MPGYANNLEFIARRYCGRGGVAPESPAADTFKRHRASVNLRCVGVSWG
jgi:hypothetical protein